MFFAFLQDQVTCNNISQVAGFCQLWMYFQKKILKNLCDVNIEL